MSDQDESTRPTLLLRLRDWDNQEAWGEFLERYAPKIYGWCRRYELQESDAAESRIDEARKEALANVRVVAGEVAQAAAAKLIGGEISEPDANDAVQRTIEERG